MWVRLAWGRLQPGGWDEYERVYREEVIPASQAVPGLLARELLRSTDNPDTGISFSSWNSLDEILAYEQSDLYQNEIQPHVEHLFTGEYWVQHYEVRLTTKPGGG